MSFGALLRGAEGGNPAPSYRALIWPTAGSHRTHQRQALFSFLHPTVRPPQMQFAVAATWVHGDSRLSQWVTVPLLEWPVHGEKNGKSSGPGPHCFGPATGPSNFSPLLAISVNNSNCVQVLRPKGCAHRRRESIIGLRHAYWRPHSGSTKHVWGVPSMHGESCLLAAPQRDLIWLTGGLAGRRSRRSARVLVASLPYSCRVPSSTTYMIGTPCMLGTSLSALSPCFSSGGGAAG